MAEISGGEYSFPRISTRASPFAALTTLYGTSLISCRTSSYRRPMKRLIENTVFSGFVTACRFATWPTSRSPSLERDHGGGGARAFLIHAVGRLTAFHHAHDAVRVAAGASNIFARDRCHSPLPQV